MISGSYCHVLEKANRRLALSWERLKKARNNRSPAFFPLATVGGWQRTALDYRLVAMPPKLVIRVYQKKKKITNPFYIS